MPRLVARLRLGLDLARRHRSAGALSLVLVLSLLVSASAFALTAGGLHRPSSVTVSHRRLGAGGEAAVSTTVTTASTTTTEAPTTTTTTTTTAPPPTTTTTARPAAPPPTAPPPPPPSPCASALPARLANRYGAGQIITVEASGYGVTSATLTAWQWSGSCWTVVDGPWTARLGFSGLSTHKHEGDGTTPAGAYGFQSTMYGNAPNPGVHYAYRSLVCGDWWDEDSSSPTYNTFQQVPCAENPPFANGASEALWTETQAYPSFAVINYNPTQIPGLGSAIFLHADIGGPTAGCVSLPLGELDSVLDWLQPGQDPVIVMGTDSTITSY